MTVTTTKEEKGKDHGQKRFVLDVTEIQVREYSEFRSSVRLGEITSQIENFAPVTQCRATHASKGRVAIIRREERCAVWWWVRVDDKLPT